MRGGAPQQIHVPGIGPQPRTRVHQVPPDHHLDGRGRRWQLRDAAGRVVRDCGPRPEPPPETPGRRGRRSAVPGPVAGPPPPTPSPNFPCQAFWVRPPGDPITRFVTTWTVPPMPRTDHGQVIYLWNGLEPTGGVSVFQPVLGWGSGEDGAPSWTVASWWVTVVGPGEYLTARSSFIPVAPGDRLVGVMTLTGQNGDFSYQCAFEGLPGTELSIAHVGELGLALEVLETWYWTEARDYPATAYGAMRQIAIDLASGPASVAWSTSDSGATVGEHATVVREARGDAADAVHLWYHADPGVTATTIAIDTGEYDRSYLAYGVYYRPGDWLAVTVVRIKHLASAPTLLLVYDAKTTTLLRSRILPGDGGFSSQIAVSPVDGTIYLADFSGGSVTLYAFDPETLAQLTSVSVGAFGDLCLAADATGVYLTLDQGLPSPAWPSDELWIARYSLDLRTRHYLVRLGLGYVEDEVNYDMGQGLGIDRDGYAYTGNGPDLYRVSPTGSVTTTTLLGGASEIWSPVYDRASQRFAVQTIEHDTELKARFVEVATLEQVGATLAAPMWLDPAVDWHDTRLWATNAGGTPGVSLLSYDAAAVIASLPYSLWGMSPPGGILAVDDDTPAFWVDGTSLAISHTVELVKLTYAEAALYNSLPAPVRATQVALERLRPEELFTAVTQVALERLRPEVTPVRVTQVALERLARDPVQGWLVVYPPGFFSSFLSAVFSAFPSGLPSGVDPTSLGLAFVYAGGKGALASGLGSWQVSSLKGTLVTTDYPPDPRHLYASALSGLEASASGYTTGFGGSLRRPLSPTGIVSVDLAQLIELTGPVLIWSGLTVSAVQGVVVLDERGADATSPLLAYWGFGSTVAVAGRDLWLTWPSNVFLKLQ